MRGGAILASVGLSACSNMPALPPPPPPVRGRYCTAVLSPALHNVLETSCKEDSEFSLKGLEKGFRAYKEVHHSTTYNLFRCSVAVVSLSRCPSLFTSGPPYSCPRS